MVFGGQDSHLPFRYLYQHSRFLALQHSLRYTFNALRMLPYPFIKISSNKSRSFGDEFEPRYILGAEPLDQ